MDNPLLLVGVDEASAIKRDFKLARAEAIQAYAYLEQSMCGLFAHFAGVTDQIAGVIFFKMNNARSRVAVSERLKRLKYGNTRSLYFNSIKAALGPIDGERNHLVHWHERFETRSNFATGAHAMSSFLDPPAYWDHSDDTPRMGIEEVQDFTSKCYALGGSIFSLTYDWEGPPFAQPWPDIFEQPVTFPLPEGHPLVPNQQAPTILPQL